MTAVEESERPGALEPARKVNATALTAAAMKLDPTDRALAAKVKLWRQDWQRHAWDFDETLSEIHYAHDYYGNTVSRVRLFAGYQVDPDDPPIALDDFDDLDEQPKGSSTAINSAALDEMRRLDAGADGGLSAIAADFAVNLALAGEGYLYGKLDPESLTGESFAVYSVEEFKPSDTGYAIYPRGSSQGIPVAPDDFVLRVWRRFRRFRDLADAPMRSLLDDCDNLLLLKRVLYAANASRMHGGIFLYPDEWTFPQRATDPNAQGQARDDPLTEQMELAFTTPLSEPRSVASVMPLLLKGPAATLKEARWIDLGRGYGGEILDQIEKVRRILAVGLDLPVEVVEGLMETTFANAAQVAEDTFRAHIEPLIMVICRALTDGYLHPMLRARGLDPAGYVVGYDPSALLGHPDLFANVSLAHERYAASDEALRRVGGMSDDDAPDEDEIRQRIFIAQQLRVTERISDPNAQIAVEPESDLAGAGSTNTLPSAADTTRSAPEQPALVAAGGRTRLDQLGTRLTQIDQDLRARIQTLADTALQRALERAGAMASRRLRGNQKGRSSMKAPDGVADVKLAELPRHLGREHLLSMGLTEDKLIDGELGELEPEYRKLTKRALAAALLAGRRAVPDGALSDDRIVTEHRKQEDWIAGGFAILSAAVLSVAHEELFTPAAVPVGPGEIDTSARVSPGAIRESLAVAGGAPAEASPSAAPPGGVATGTIVMDAFRDALQILPQGWQWVYGYPDREFEPHANLEGQEFSSWEDEILLNDQDWPDTQWYRPGDHQGCVVAGTIVAGQVPSATTLRWYEGIVIELATASGQQLTITPNHPVLTDRGWVKADALVEGDHVIRCLDPGRAAGLIPDDDQAPTRVEDLFAARWVSPEVIAACVPVAAEDFHGDGLGSEVTVVCADRDLVTDGHPSFREPLSEHALAEAGRTARGLAGASSAFEGLDRVGDATLRFMRGGGHRLAVLRGCETVTEDLSLAIAPRSQAMALEPDAECGTADAEVFGHGEQAVSSVESQKEIGFVNVEPEGGALLLPLAAWRDPDLSEPIPNGLVAHAEMLAHGHGALAGEVELDKLVHVERLTMVGHVFNLHNDLAWYTANGIIVHNCACSFIAMFESDRGDTEPPPEEG